MPPTSRQDSESWAPIWTSIGLFLITTAVAQYAEALARGVHRKNNEEEDLEELRRWYHSRRVHDRLSYENIQDSLPVQEPGQSSHLEGVSLHPCLESSLLPSASFRGESEFTIRRGNGHTASQDIPQPQARCLSEWDELQQARQNRAPFPSLERRDSHATLAPPHPNADYDFHPKNRNWRHFEAFNETDPRRKQQLQSPPRILKSFSTTSTLPSIPPPEQSADQAASVDDRIQKTGEKAAEFPHVEIDQDENDDEDDDDALSISSSGSESSEEQFVWMNHSHRRKSALSPKESRDTWGVPSFLNLFRQGDVVPDDNVKTNEKPNHTQSFSGDPNLNEFYIKQSSTPPIATLHKSFPMSESSLDAQNEMPTSFPLALQRMFSRRLSGGSTSTSPVEPVQYSGNHMGRQLSGGSMSRSGTQHRELRAQYNAAIMPEKVILMRHGQSMGNINELLYSTTPDNAMPLTPLGWEQARQAGQILKDKILGSGQTVHFIVSPYVRTVETFHGMVSAWSDPKDFSHILDREKRIKAWYRRLMELGLTWNEDSRIREQDFGNYQDPETIRKAKKERHRFGVFYYRFPHGESASDVFDRVSTFLDSLWRSFEMNKSQNYVLVTHGISIRVLLARYFRYTIDQFNILANPQNCEMVVLGHNGQGRLELQGRCALELGAKEAMDGEGEGKNESRKKDREVAVTGYRFHRRLRILPKSAIRKVKIRISPDG